MPLFRENPIRSTAAAAIGLVIAYTASSYLSSPSAFHVTQTTVALLALAAFMVLVTLNHRREGREGPLMTQTQEEIVLIGSFALFWLAVMLAWRAISQNTGIGTEIGMSTASQTVQRSKGATGRGAASYCGKDDLYCMIEEYYY